MKKQLVHFSESLSETFSPGVPLQTAGTWDDAFKLMHQLIENSKTKGKVVLFLDELPWMASRRSGLLQTLDYYWNHHWSKKSNILLIVCGSSASWLLKNVIHHRGGLHNRCTCEIELAPFTLKETQAYLQYREIKLNRQHMLILYMALGGVPYYLKYVERGLSAHQNIQKLVFDKQAPLKGEFNKLFQSLFTEAEHYIEIITLLASKKLGMSRAELEKKSKLSKGGGRLTTRLQQLIQTHFIKQYLPWEKQRGEYYKVTDEFCLFYIHCWVQIEKKVLLLTIG